MHKFEDVMALSAEADRMSLENSRREAALLMSSQVNTLQKSMNEFMTAVSTMEDTVMVPSMLRDIGVIRGVDGVTKCPPTSNAASLYHFYAMLRSMKTELARGLPGADGSNGGVSTNGSNGKTHLHRQLSGHNGQRRHTLQANAPLNGGLLQQNPTTYGINGSNGHDTPAHLIDANTTDRAVLMADDFRAHMAGLLHTLHELTATAQYVTTLYKQEVGDN